MQKKRKAIYMKCKTYGGGIPDYTQLNEEASFWSGYRDAITEMIDFVNNYKIENKHILLSAISDFKNDRLKDKNIYKK